MDNDKSFDSSKALLAEIRKEPRSQVIIEQCLAEGADINYQDEGDGYTALMLAVDKDDEPLVAYLLQQGANPLIKNHHQEIASDLALTHSPIYKLLKNNELIMAVLLDDSELVKKALTAGADINYQGAGGYNAMMVAVENDNLEMVELLVPYKPNPYRKNDAGYNLQKLSENKLIRKTISVGKPLTPEEKIQFFEKLKTIEKESAERKASYSLSRLRMLEERKTVPFSLSQLEFDDIDPPATEADIQALEAHLGHRLPAVYKELVTHYNGASPKACYFGASELASIRFFYRLHPKEQEIFSNGIWSELKILDYRLPPDSLPLASTLYEGGFFYLRWRGEEPEVWLNYYLGAGKEFRQENYRFFQESFLDQSFVDVDYCHFLISPSLQLFLESLYAVEA
ncbi:TPA: ankyrin repeat domain-containing protein [Legionella feeleii]